MEFLEVLVFCLRISPGVQLQVSYNFANFQGKNFVLSGISRGEVRNLEIPGFFSKNYVLNPSSFFFFFFVEQPISLSTLRALGRSSQDLSDGVSISNRRILIKYGVETSFDCLLNLHHWAEPQCLILSSIGVVGSP